jgi:hypothetical protein
MSTITDDSKLRVSFCHCEALQRPLVPCHSHTMSSIEIGKISVAGINGVIFADFRVNRPDTIFNTLIVFYPRDLSCGWWNALRISHTYRKKIVLSHHIITRVNFVDLAMHQTYQSKCMPHI